MKYQKINILPNLNVKPIVLNAFIFFAYTLLFSLENDHYIFKQILLFIFFLTYLLTCNELKINYKFLILSFFVILFSFLFKENINNYHLIPILYLIVFIFNNKDRSFYLENFFFFLNSFVFFLSILILLGFNNYVNFQNTSFIIIGLPGLFYIKNKLYFYLNLSTLALISFLFLERQIFLILLIILLLNFLKSENEKNLNKLFFITIFANLVFLIYLINLKDSIFLNDIFNKRPVLYDYYFQLILKSNIVNIIFGHGYLENDNEFFFNMAEYFSWLQFRFRSFSPHNFILILTYTYGLFGLIVLFLFLCKFFSLDKIFKEKKIMLIFLITGTLQSFNFLSHQPVSIMFSLLVITTLKSESKNFSNI